MAAIFLIGVGAIAAGIYVAGFPAMEQIPLFSRASPIENWCLFFLCVAVGLCVFVLTQGADRKVTLRGTLTVAGLAVWLLLFGIYGLMAFAVLGFILAIHLMGRATP